MINKVVVTGFEPFGNSTINPSQEVANKIKGMQLDGIKIETAILPVVFGESSAKLLELVDAIEPNIVICLGQAEGRSAISVERFAINLNDARIGDNAGNQLSDQEVVPGAPLALSSTLPFKDIVQSIKDAGIPAEVSLTAGTFVCNHIFYALQHKLQLTNTKSGFIHLPVLPEQSEFQGKPTMELDQMVTGVLVAIRSTISN
jgi:pyroglutamyl-peptidase